MIGRAGLLAEDMVVCRLAGHVYVNANEPEDVVPHSSGLCKLSWLGN
jgi:hypothetical protein